MIFSPIDHVIVRAAVKRLPEKLADIVIWRFWQEWTLAEMGRELGMDSVLVAESISEALGLLHDECLRHPAFSLGNRLPKQMTEAC